MRTSYDILKLVIFIVLSVFCSTHVYSIDKTISLNKKNQNLVVDFFKTDTLVIVLPDVYTLSGIEKADIENAVFWESDQLRPEYVYKSESEVIKQDYKKHILFYGCMNQFQRKDFLSIPVKKGKKGFRFNNKEFDQPTDAFFYVNNEANRMYLCKNTEKIRHCFFTMGGTTYPLHIFSGDKIVITGVF